MKIWTATFVATNVGFETKLGIDMTWGNVSAMD